MSSTQEPCVGSSQTLGENLSVKWAGIHCNFIKIESGFFKDKLKKKSISAYFCVFAHASVYLCMSKRSLSDP